LPPCAPQAYPEDILMRAAISQRKMNVFSY
jgi:hypothetical protein